MLEAHLRTVFPLRPARPVAKVARPARESPAHRRIELLSRSAVRHRRSGGVMFFLFSRKLGCAGSLAVSAGLSLLLLALLGWL